MVCADIERRMVSTKTRVTVTDGGKRLKRATFTPTSEPARQRCARQLRIPAEASTVTDGV
jgi:hypothetical protein